MKKTKFKVGEVQVLNFELNGNQKISGLLHESVSFKTKYWLNKLADDVAKEVKTFGKVRDELLKKLGTEDKDGNFSIKPSDENWKEFEEQIEAISNEIIEISYAEFLLEDFDFKSNNNYHQFSKLLSVPDEEIEVAKKPIKKGKNG